MKKKFIWTVLCGLGMSSGGMAVTEETFKNPPNDYRITQYQLTSQTLEKYPQYGVGGVMGFFYSILYPECGKQQYKMGENGPEIIGELVDAARAIDYKVWLADDWGYPSGMAGGRVVAENPDFEVRSLVMLTQKGQGEETIDFSLPDDLHDIIYASLNSVSNGAVQVPVETGSRSLSGKGVSGDWKLRVFARYTRNKDTQGQSTVRQFGHAGRYPDLMNREAMSRFLANMHEPILAQIDDPASKVEGFYCNEPNLMQTHWNGKTKAPYACAPWSDALPARFKTMHGYDLFSVLPAVFEGEDDDARRARIHYRQAVGDLLTDSFSRQIREWCNERGIKSSGHYLLNDYLTQHVQGYGDLMKFVSEFDVPALDIPIPNPDQFLDFRYQQSRFFSSVAAWKEKDQVIMLLDPIIGGYGLTRLSPDLPLLLNSINMASFHGVTLFTSYLPFEARSGEGETGRQEAAKGYTAEEFRFVNEYTGRITQVLRGAKRDAGVALYYPIAMFQADLLASDMGWGKINQLHQDKQEAWDATELTLINGDVSYMIVHPEAVADAEIAGGHLKIGYGSYHTLVMPAMEFLPLDVAQQLSRFQESGGKIIWVDSVPYAAEHAKHDAEVKALLEQVSATDMKGVVPAIGNSFSDDFNLTFSPGSDQLVVGRFHQKNKPVYFLVNRMQDELPIKIIGEGQVKLLDPSTGEISSVRLPAKRKLGAVRSLIVMP
ncbi:hypothetical protein PDESU_02585 [Pontiella desulfatans]|uniref:Glycoside hydrolase family 42 N-terminal domain-containing protein n=1 Tax=Pontiella desulfatans TaxID=2750659 RepID=A0A6C2U220_PONDE|nr:hypothetical protein [Pontiella desulfatans]VGO14028.1 hypothetical protein PDESU_02585 [Pontiella desulfatans]